MFKTSGFSIATNLTMNFSSDRDLERMKTNIKLKTDCMVFTPCIFKSSGGSYILCTFSLNVVFVVVIYVYASLNPKIMHILLLHVAEMMGRSFAWLISHHLQQIRYELH